ncbi:hypothetical protein [Gallid alphaherpesvirus 2]|uniref:Uncharacterized protein n=1 Tax=Gallid alphaherpesvirus 2 TaxID=10390 RepID=I6TK00_9ALPH|nr:hypothetical protein [Gallid alphaherpesvirus 2]
MFSKSLIFLKTGWRTCPQNVSGMAPRFRSTFSLCARNAMLAFKLFEVHRRGYKPDTALCNWGGGGIENISRDIHLGQQSDTYNNAVERAWYWSMA